VYAEDINYLRQLVDAEWPEGVARPLVAGPDCNPTHDPTWIDSFLSNTQPGAMTYHNYVGYGLDPLLAQQMMDTSWDFFNAGPQKAEAFISGWQNISREEGTEIWVGEIAAAWHSGQPGVTDKFISSFWYADALGLLATLNHTVFQRQCLSGGNYALLALDDSLPQSDFFIAQLYHDFMGKKVMMLDSDGKNDGLRTYAQCSNESGDGGATALLINASPTNTFTVSNIETIIPDTSNAGLYVISAGDGVLDGWEGLDSRLVHLNGEIVGDKQAAPLPDPMELDAEDFTLPPLTITFVVNGGGVEFCQ